ncbi:hypothetical protein SESBI_39616 [Sesbania bispinosa]|nr:hypothetical protein SESBI_39616 [Sesbania bispinosa]
MHAISTIASKNKRPEEYCHGWLTMGAYQTTYEHFVKPTQSQQFWEKTDYAAPVPPPIKRSVGRPKIQRRRDVNEEPTNATRLKRSYADVICSRCGHNNHNIRKCTNIGVPQKPRNWVDPAPAEPQEANNNPQGGPDELDLSQGLPSANLPDSQLNNNQPTNVDSNSPELAPTTAQPTIALSPTSKITSGQATSRPPSRGRNLRNPLYKPPGTVPGGFRQKLNTVRPPNVTHSAPPEATHHNSIPQQSQLQPSHETILEAS